MLGALALLSYAACARGPSGPGGAAVTGTALPVFDLAGLDESGLPARITREGAASAGAKVLLVRLSAAWCGTCRWHAAHTRDVLALGVGASLQLLEVLVGDEANGSPDLAALESWRGRLDTPLRIASDPERVLYGAVGSKGLPLPVYLIVDPRSKMVLRALGDPDLGALAAALADSLGRSRGAALPAGSGTAFGRGRFTEEGWAMVQELRRPGAPPADPSNARADDARAAALGKLLFSDASLSPGGQVACTSCHDPKKELADGEARSTAGVSAVSRNAPALGLAAHGRWQFWDGRADSLWAQALGPLEAAAEFGGSRLFVDHAVFRKYRAEYEAAWGPMPDLADSTRFPATGKPGSPEWAAMSPEDQDAATLVFVNVGKSIAAYERTFRVQPNALDRFLDGDDTALTAPELDGLVAFVAAGCLQCHYGPRLTDDAFHVIGLPTGRPDGQPDRGRIDGIASLLESEFNQTTRWSDARRAALDLRPEMIDLGAFKTPPLRGVAQTAPYGHGGTSATLEDAVAKHPTLQAQDERLVGSVEPWIVEVDPELQAAIIPFLRCLEADPIVP